MSQDKEIGPVIWRTLRGCCPNCGQGKLMASYLKQVKTCSVCGEDLGHIRADDAPPWLTILIVGHIIVPLALIAEQHTVWPSWVAMLVWSLLSLAMCLWMLPYAKQMFIGIIWATRAPGSEKA